MAFTFGTISSVLIEVATGTGTLAELYADLYAEAGDAETYMTRTGADPYVYTVVGNRKLDLVKT